LNDGLLESSSVGLTTDEFSFSDVHDWTLYRTRSITIWIEGSTLYLNSGLEEFLLCSQSKKQCGYFLLLFSGVSYLLFAGH
jgi:hypothetical protein